MAQSFHLHEQAERCRRLARDSTDPNLRDSLLKLADEYAARARAQENDETDAGPNEGAAVWQAGSGDQGDA
jgi:hypothetical protein